MSRAVRTARKAVAQHVKPKTQGKEAFQPSQLLRFVYEAFPEPINCTTLVQTRGYAEDPAHPFHIRTQRRLEQFDPRKLHWRVQCPIDVSKKSFIRSWAVKRVRSAIRKELSTLEYETVVKTPASDDSGERQDADPAAQPRREAFKLAGALQVILSKSSVPLTATDDQVKESASWLIERAVTLRKVALEKRRVEDKRGVRQAEKDRIALGTYSTPPAIIAKELKDRRRPTKKKTP